MKRISIIFGCDVKKKGPNSLNFAKLPLYKFSEIK